MAQVLSSMGMEAQDLGPLIFNFGTDHLNLASGYNKIIESNQESTFYSIMHQEEYSLTWQNYSDHLRSMMKELMLNEDFSDVTLVTEDKKQIKANINILSTCSPVFKDILSKEKMVTFSQLAS